MQNRELKRLIQDTAEDLGINGVMELARLVKKEKGLSYERVSKVWQGSVTTKLCDVADVADVLGMKIKFVSKAEVK